MINKFEIFWIFMCECRKNIYVVVGVLLLVYFFVILFVLFVLFVGFIYFEISSSFMYFNIYIVLFY